ncbi:MAG TPA: tetratricopeptide repeat protein, partial [bacterium]|nr:tetratricopeptide repeat protein [bacterium]
MTAPARPLSLFWTTPGLPALLALLCWTAAPARGDDLSRALGKDFNAGNFARVEESVQAALDRDPGQPRLWLELGALRQAEGDNAGALAAYQACGADSFPLRLDEANTLLRLAKLDDAEALYQRLNAEKPDDARILWGLAQVDGDRARWDRFRTFAGRQAAWARSQAW